MDRSKIKRVGLIILFCFFFLSDCQAAPQSINQNNGYSGILYGYIHNIRPDFSAITLKPIQIGDRRHRINLDQSTLVFVNKKKRQTSSLYLGDKVAVRYFGCGTTIMADAVYVVFGEFVPKDYVVRKRLLIIKKETDAKDKKGEPGAESGKDGKKDSKPKEH